MIAHVAGVPVEEALLPLSGAGVWLLLARGWVAARLRQRGSQLLAPDERRRRRVEKSERPRSGDGAAVRRFGCCRAGGARHR
jgi:hypothetical protein